MNYDFPVSLEDIFLKDGTQIPKTKAVVRRDTIKPIATVSNNYRLVEHKVVMDEALKYVKKLGTPKSEFHVSNTGTKAIGEFTYSDKTIAVRKGDMVGLRVYVENTYNATSSIKVRIGGMVLACMNGMMLPKDVFSLNVVHKGEPVFEFPTPETVMSHFTESAKKLQTFAKYELSPQDMVEHQAMAFNDGIVAERFLDREMTGDNAWDFYNHITYDITHNENARATYIGRLGRLNRAAAWMDETFGAKQ